MNKFISILGWIGTAISVAMYVAYIDQIGRTLGDATGPWIQPLVAGINCTIWTCYGLFKTPRDLPIAFANMPGVFFGFTAAISALI